MKILLFGFLTLFGWSVLSTYIYVCKIKGLCTELITAQTNKVNHIDITAGAEKSKYSASEPTEFPNDLIVYFEFDKFELDTDVGTDNYFEESNKYLSQNLQAMISITGYTDAVGSDEYNQALGYRRAQSMQQYLESKGMPANKISIKSNGENAPVDDNTSKIGMATNRRTAVTIKK
jgi:outer membrane protein OmpA-like peptidoglycan-associated protein